MGRVDWRCVTDKAPALSTWPDVACFVIFQVRVLMPVTIEIGISLLRNVQKETRVASLDQMG